MKATKAPKKKEESQLCSELHMFVRLSIDIPSINPRSNGTFLRELCQIGYCESRAIKTPAIMSHGVRG